MKRSLAFVLMAGFLVAANDPRMDIAKEDFHIQHPDEKKIQGTWVGVFFESDGQQLPADIIKHTKVVFKGDKCSASMPGVAENQVSNFRLDTTKSPKWIDVTHANGGSKGQTWRGIYTLDGNELRVCSGAAPGDKRPTEFASKAGPRVIPPVRFVDADLCRRDWRYFDEDFGPVREFV